MSGRMKSDRPAKGGPRRRRASWGSPSRLPTLVAVVTVLVLWAAVGGAILSSSGGGGPSDTRPNTAVIVDQPAVACAER